ncbi:MAG: hypothetical protein AAFR04_14585 [Pseudomonadota bacterium]
MAKSERGDAQTAMGKEIGTGKGIGTVDRCPSPQAKDDRQATAQGTKAATAEPASSRASGPSADMPRKKRDGKARSRLETFRAPTPHRTLIKALGPVNRVLCLHGLPLLRDVPLLSAVPGIRGLMDVRRLDFPAADRARFKAAVNSETAAFITPNHPEFFTDWMIDKDVLVRHAPLAACWATHTIVNGLGAFAQGFWLRNNLIAQIPGEGGQAGRAHSVAWALKGHGVLLHPEGTVGWHGDHVGPLFAGAVDMALQAARRIEDQQDQLGGVSRAVVVPIAWKLKFNRDVTAALHRELDLIEARLTLPTTGRNAREASADPARRAYAIYDALLARDEIAYAQHPTRAPYFERHKALLAKVHDTLMGELDAAGAPAYDEAEGVERATRRAARHLRAQSTKRDAPATRSIREKQRTLLRLNRMRPAFYPGARITQEQVAETLKRLRADYCMATGGDRLHNLIPRPVGARTAYVRVADPLDLSQALRTVNARAEEGDGAAASACEDALVARTVETLRGTLQGLVDGINAELEGSGQPRTITYANPFAGFHLPREPETDRR